MVEGEGDAPQRDRKEAFQEREERSVEQVELWNSGTRGPTSVSIRGKEELVARALDHFSLLQ